MKHCIAILALGFGLTISACGPTSTPVNNAAESNTSAPAVEQSAETVMTAAKKTLETKETYGSFKLEYPEFGNASVDAVIAKYAEEELAKAKLNVEKIYNENKENLPEEEISNYVAFMNYEVVQARKNDIDIVFTHQGYTGGAHGYLYLTCMSMDGNGNLINVLDLAGSDEASLTRISELSRKQLREKIENSENIEDMIDGGTTPVRENFESILRTENGYRIYFDPYNVAPWSEGVLFVDIPKAE